MGSEVSEVHPELRINQQEQSKRRVEITELEVKASEKAHLRPDKAEDEYREIKF